MIFLLLLPLSSLAAPLLSSTTDFTVKKERQEAGVAQKPMDSFYSELLMDFESYDVNDPSGVPLMSTKTDQLMKMKKLPKLDPKDPAFPKDGFNERIELTFERLINSSKVRIPGLNKPFETKADLGGFLSKRPLVIRGDGKEGKKVDRLEEIRNEALAQFQDPVSRTTILTILSESMLLKSGAAPSQSGSCLADFAQKKPGSKWKFSREEQGVKLGYECEFEGWAEAGGKKVAVLKVHSPKQRTLRQQPNGVPGMAETSGDGRIFFEPGSQESLMRMETTILVEPAEAELKQLQAKGETVPRNRSVMRHWSHLYALEAPAVPEKSVKP